MKTIIRGQEYFYSSSDHYKVKYKNFKYLKYMNAFIHRRDYPEFLISPNLKNIKFHEIKKEYL